MNAEQIRDEYLAKAREEARVSGRDIEVTSLAFAQASVRIAELEGARAKDAAELASLRAERDELSDQFITNAQRLGSVCYSWHNWAVEIVGKEAARRMSGQDMRDEIARRLAGCTTDQAEPRKRRGPGPDGPPKAGDPQDADKDGDL